MGIRPQQMEDRTPVEGVEIEYDRVVSSRRSQKVRLNRARLLSISKDKLELGAREAFPTGTKLNLIIHARRVRNFATVEGEVSGCSRVRILKQPAYCVQVELPRLTKDQERKIAWAAAQFAPAPSPGPDRGRGPDEEPMTAGMAAAGPAEPVSVRPAAEREGAAVAPGPRVKRPVALLELIGQLDKFEVSEDLILAVLEAAEAGMDVEVLFPVKRAEESTDSELEEIEEEVVEEAAVPEGQARPLNVYRLSSTTRLHFADEGLPVGPALELIYVSRLRSPQSCFAVNLGNDSMTQDGTPSFKPGSILIFSAKGTVESGNYAFVKTRTSDDFAQVFFERSSDDLRVRPLNPKHPERVVRRHEIRALCKLVGVYQDYTD